MGIQYGNTLQESETGLELFLDSGNIQSYPRSGIEWYDLSGNNRTAYIYGKNPFDPEYGGRFKYIDPQDTDYVSLPASALRATANNYTIEFWLQPITPPGETYLHSVSNGSNHNAFLVSQGTDNTIGLGDSRISFSNGIPLQFVLVRDGAAGSLYKNGAFASTNNSIGLVNDAADGGWILNQEQDSLGGGFSAAQNYRGYFMIVKVYSITLSSEEILKNFNKFKSRYGL